MRFIQYLMEVHIEDEEKLYNDLTDICSAYGLTYYDTDHLFDRLVDRGEVNIPATLVTDTFAYFLKQKYRDMRLYAHQHPELKEIKVEFIDQRNRLLVIVIYNHLDGYIQPKTIVRTNSNKKKSLANPSDLPLIRTPTAK